MYYEVTGIVERNLYEYDCFRGLEFIKNKGLNLGDISICLVYRISLPRCLRTNLNWIKPTQFCGIDCIYPWETLGIPFFNMDNYRYYLIESWRCDLFLIWKILLRDIFRNWSIIIYFFLVSERRYYLDIKQYLLI